MDLIKSDAISRFPKSELVNLLFQKRNYVARKSVSDVEGQNSTVATGVRLHFDL